MKKRVTIRSTAGFLRKESISTAAMEVMVHSLKRYASAWSRQISKKSQKAESGISFFPDNPEHYLETHGWCKIYKALFDTQYRVYVGGDLVITDAQMKTLIDLGLEDAKDLSAMLCKDGNKTGY